MAEIRSLSRFPSIDINVQAISAFVFLSIPTQHSNDVSVSKEIQSLGDV